MANPGDSVYTIGTIHLDLANKACVVEVATGILGKSGIAQLTTQNVLLTTETIAGAQAFADAIAKLVLALDTDRKPAGLVDAVPYVTPTVLEASS